jgi:hypothetical protein
LTMLGSGACPQDGRAGYSIPRQANSDFSTPARVRTPAAALARSS